MHEKAVDLVVSRPRDPAHRGKKFCRSRAVDQVGPGPRVRPHIGHQPVRPDPALRHRQLGADVVQLQKIPMLRRLQGQPQRGQEIVVKNDVILHHKGMRFAGGQKRLPHRQMRVITADAADQDLAPHIAPKGGDVGVGQKPRFFRPAIDAGEKGVGQGHAGQLSLHLLAPGGRAGQVDQPDRQIVQRVGFGNLHAASPSHASRSHAAGRVEDSPAR